MQYHAEARQVIGVAINQHFVSGVLTDLDGWVILRHEAALDSTAVRDVFDLMVEVVNGLFAQLTAPLLCLSVGVSGVVDDRNGIVRYAPRLGWRDVPLAEMLHQVYEVPVYISNSYELAALGQFTFKTANWTTAWANTATVQVGASVGIGLIRRNAETSTGGEIGSLTPTPEIVPRFDDRLGWSAVESRAKMLATMHRSEYLSAPELNYTLIRYATAMGDTAAVALLEELAGHVAEIFAWVILLAHPQGVSLTGTMAILGESFLELVKQKTEARLLHDHLYRMEFRIDETPHLPALGAAAKGIRQEKE